LSILRVGKNDFRQRLNHVADQSRHKISNVIYRGRPSCLSDEWQSACRDVIAGCCWCCAKQVNH